MGYLWVIWQRMPLFTARDTSGTVGFSVLVAVRNEADHLPALLDALEQLIYPRDAFEVIFINDHSNDTTVTLLRQAQAKYTFALRLLHNSPEVSGKKAALLRGIAAARFPTLLTTDGDCVVSPHWLAAFAAAKRTTGAVLLSGPVRMSGRGWWAHLQSVEFASLIGTGAVLLRKGHPVLANGANLCYDKAAFVSVGGFAGHQHLPSGDDIFLLEKMNMAFPGKVHFLKSSDAIVQTRPQVQLTDFVQQRLRWASKWQSGQGRATPLLALAVVSFHGLHLLAWLWWVEGYLWVGLCLKVLTELGVLALWLRFLGQSRQRVWIPLAQGLYSFYALFFGFLVFRRKKYQWKGRYYHRT
ncbi:MAG: glycosyltransferase [Bernardetiaceae bacterium]